MTYNIVKNHIAIKIIHDYTLNCTKLHVKCEIKYARTCKFFVAA